MRTFLSAAACVVALSSPADAATRNFGITGFEKVRVEGPFRVVLTTGVAPFARATGSAAALERVAIDMIGSTLVVHKSLSAWGGYPGQDPGPVEIALGTHDLSVASLSGSGALRISAIKGLKFQLSVEGSGLTEVGNVAVDQLSVNVQGSSAARLGGETGKLNATLRGVSTLDAGALAIKDAAFNADGAATIEATVGKTAKVDAVGPATIRLAGRPACTLNLRGSATVSGCR